MTLTIDYKVDYREVLEMESNKTYRMQYKVVGRWRKDETFNFRSEIMTSESEAKRRLEELCKKFKLERDTKSCQVDYSSGLGVSTPYDSDYDMMELKIVSREVSNWEDL